VVAAVVVVAAHQVPEEQVAQAPKAVEVVVGELL
jgi:hypothetical protein